MKGYLILIFAVILICLEIFCVLTFVLPANRLIIEAERQTASLSGRDSGQDKKDKENSNSVLSVSGEKDEKIILYAVGDIMLDRGVEYMVYKYGGTDYKFPFLKISEELKKADILFGNLESQISDKGKKIGTVNSFRAEPKAMEGLKFSGFDIVSVANNHAFDYDIPALEDSFNRLKEAGIIYTGGGFNKEEAFGLKIIEKKGVKIGFLAYCLVGSKWWKAEAIRSGIAFISQNDIEEIKKDIKSAKEKVDILIVSSHSGTEYQENPDDQEVYLYISFIDAGADLVLGHHPHVSQLLEGYPPGWIVYSLGNFVFDQGFSENTMKGTLLEVVIKNKKIEKVNEKQIKMNSYFQPELTLTEN